MTKIYVVVSAFQGCISEVSAHLQEGDAKKEQTRLRRELGIIKGHEEESPNAVEIRPVEVAL
jgi:hypothetical protein